MALLCGCGNTYNIRSGKVENTHSSTDFASLSKTVGDRVFFDYDSSKLSQQAKVQLDKQIKWLEAHRNMGINIEGHCDERGTEDYNMALGARRAEQVKEYMIYNGLMPKRIDTTSYGKSRPSIIGNTEEAWERNRRAVTVLKR